ncbi:SnoaL-like protein [Jatrophihabitans sp. GAS493]|uniref:nuclear transport factor 2 family protein n=1 Tax=Jatrophihabitans sp. GAS493 TaxID=1907575 RepID=UPI000BB6B0E1|nr:nuclear transport factor 2 family protein [Jatrophihabitans sp. GAS493]SOD71403.1 SnoaL-like protein [Jatrophihabitans sp. GAS493]
MHPNEELIHRFYRALNDKDAETMGACYADTATFTDPAFGRLNATEVRGMWSMLLGRSKDLRAELSGVRADDDTGAAHWDAYYTFGARKVHNSIDATFGFRDGLIIEHTDVFDWPRWAGQALGIGGRLLGRTSYLHEKARATARQQLDAYLADH